MANPFTKKTWLKRIVEFPSRRKLTETNEVGVYDIERNEGNISQKGDGFTVDNMNDLETRISNGFNEINNNLTPVSYSLAEYATSGVAVNSVYSHADVQGGTVVLQVYVTSNVPTGTVLMTLPAFLRPKRQAWIPIFPTAGGSSVGRLIIEPSGAVTTLTPSTFNTLTAFGPYMIAP